MELHYLKIAVEVPIRNTNEKLAVMQEKNKTTREFDLKIKPQIYNWILPNIKNLNLVIQKGLANFKKGPIYILD